MTTANLRATGQARFALDRALVRRIVDSGAEGQDCHLEVVFADGSAHHATPVGEPDITIVFRHRRAQWRMAFGGVFEFLESYFNGDVEIVGEHGLRPRGIGLISATFNMRARPRPSGPSARSSTDSASRS